MLNKEEVISDLETSKVILCNPSMINDSMLIKIGQAITNGIYLLKAYEPRELTKDEWQIWKKDQRRNPICMVFEGDTTPFWVLRPEEVNEVLYLMGKIKLFTNKPEKEMVKWDG